MSTRRAAFGFLCLAVPWCFAGVEACGGNVRSEPGAVTDSGSPPADAPASTSDGAGPSGDAAHDAPSHDGAPDAAQDSKGWPDVSEPPDPCFGIKLTFQPPDGTTFEGQGDVTIAGSAALPSNATIFYTTNGTIPTHSSNPYIGPIHLTTSASVYAILTAPGCFDAPPSHATYTVDAVDGGLPADAGGLDP